MDAFDNLKNAIVRQAAEDYAAAFMGCSIDGKSPEDTMLECERFFRSDWYDTLTRGAVDGEWLMRNIKIRELENTLEIYKDILSSCNCCTIKAAVAFLHDKGGKKRKPLNYIFPPRLASGLMDMARIQLETLKTELEELKKQDGEVSV